jgi:hypothetical protein
VQAEVTESQAEAEASGIKDRELAAAAGIEARGLAEAKAIEQKAAAMKLFHDAGKDHEEFKLRLAKDRDVALAEIHVQKDIAQAHSHLVGEALKHSNIDIVGGENDFFEKIVRAVGNGKAVDRLVDNSATLTDIKNTFFNGDPEHFKTQLRAWIDAFGLRTEDLKNLSIAALLGKLPPRARATKHSTIASALNLAKSARLRRQAGRLARHEVPGLTAVRRPVALLVRAACVRSRRHVRPFPAPATPPPRSAASALGSATYEIIRQRLQAHGAALRERMARLDARRQEVFGAIESKLLQSDRITTAHNCVPRDMVPLGQGRFLFGFNVLFGLKKEIELADVFAAYERDEARARSRKDLRLPRRQGRSSPISNGCIRSTRRPLSAKFSLIGGHLYFVFQVGAGGNDIAVFKWAFDGGQLRYVDGRAEAEFRRRVSRRSTNSAGRRRTARRSGTAATPHVSIEDRVFVDCIGRRPDLKVEDNTATGEGIYAEPVEDRNQKVDDAEIAYATPLPHLIRAEGAALQGNRTALLHLQRKAAHRRARRFDRPIVRAPARRPRPDLSRRLLPRDRRAETLRQPGARPRPRTHRACAQRGGLALRLLQPHRRATTCCCPTGSSRRRSRSASPATGSRSSPTATSCSSAAATKRRSTTPSSSGRLRSTSPATSPPGQRDAFLYQVGNKDVVRCLAECNEVLTLVGREPPTPNSTPIW